MLFLNYRSDFSSDTTVPDLTQLGGCPVVLDPIQVQCQAVPNDNLLPSFLSLGLFNMSRECSILTGPARPIIPCKRGFCPPTAQVLAPAPILQLQVPGGAATRMEKAAAGVLHLHTPAPSSPDRGEPRRRGERRTRGRRGVEGGHDSNLHAKWPPGHAQRRRTCGSAAQRSATRGGAPAPACKCELVVDGQRSHAAVSPAV